MGQMVCSFIQKYSVTLIGYATLSMGDITKIVWVLVAIPVKQLK